ncbi:MAG: fatty acid desaturase family protein [Archangium sp.]|nr:fatty acid desaturase family protein [Archangium sp.]
MSAKIRHTAATWLSPEEISQFTRASNASGALSIATSWALIAAAFVLLAHFPTSPLAWLTTLVILGGRQLALAILMHECAHHSLFATPALNQHVGQWLCAAPVWQRLTDYRTHHIKHHGRTSLEDDPDLGLANAFPTTRASLLRKFLRDVTGIAFIRRVVALLLMDAGVISYTASTGAKRVEPRPTVARMLKQLATNFGPTLLTNAVLATILWTSGNPWLYAVWVLAWATTFSVFVRIRSIAEHGMTATSTDPLLNTRTTQANPLARLTVAPHHVNYHLEHHLLPKVPHYKLTALHHLLKERGAYLEATEAKGYGQVLRLAVSHPRR